MMRVDAHHESGGRGKRGLPVTIGSRACHAAFTLIELVVVMTLLAVAVGMIVPRMGKSIGRVALREAAGRLAQTARTVGALAVARRQELTLEIDLSRGAYRILMPSSDGAPGELTTVQGSWLRGAQWPKSIRVRDFRRGDGTRATGGSERIRFYPDGTSSGAALQLTDADTTQQIIIHAHSGRVSWGDPRTMSLAPDQVDLGD